MKLLILLTLTIAAVSAVPNLRAAEPLPDVQMQQRQTTGLPTLPDLSLKPVCAKNCLKGIKSCSVTAPGSLINFATCPLNVIICAVNCLVGELPVGGDDEFLAALLGEKVGGLQGSVGKLLTGLFGGGSTRRLRRAVHVEEPEE